MKLQKQIDIRLIKGKMQSPIELVQYDTGVQLIFNFLDFDIPDGTNVILYVQKRSGKFVYQENGITVASDNVTIDLENQALTEHGETFYQLRLKNGEDIISTFYGTIYVKKSLADANAEESKTVVSAFEDLTNEQIAKVVEAAEMIAEQVKATLPEDYTTMAAKVNEFANAIKGNLKGAVVVADDVSPVEHEMVVNVRSKNLAERKNPNTTVITEGITYTVNDDGTISANGTATATAYYLMLGNTTYDTQIPIKKGKYTIQKAPARGCRISVGLRNSKTVERILYYSTYENEFTFEVTNDTTRFDMILCVDTGYTVENALFKPQIEEGTIATAYEPYIDPTTAKVRRCGKNIFEVTGKTQTLNGVTFTVNGDGTVVASGTATKATFISLGKLYLKPEEKYRLSGSPSGSGFDTYMLYIHNNTTGADIYDLGEGKVFTGKEGDIGVTVVVYAGNTVNNLIFRPMVVYGEEIVAFEPYNGAEYIPALDGTVAGMTTLSPNMTIITDTKGMIVECEYNVDTKKYIKKHSGGSARIGNVVLTANGWVGAKSPYSQVVSVEGVTKNSQVDLTPSVEQLAIFYEKDLAFVTENDSGVVTVYAIGQKPQNDYTIQVTITEVAV